jgi:plastocyanin
VKNVVGWKNVDIFRRTASATDGSFDMDLPAGATGRTTLRRTGVVTYFCRFHSGMNGRLDVAPQQRARMQSDILAQMPTRCCQVS